MNDRGTAALMEAFHHFLGTGLRPEDALRAAQLWLLEPERPVLAGASVPAVRRAAFDDVCVWAAFGHQGR